MSIMIAKGYKLPITSNEMIDFKIQLSASRNNSEFVDAWDYGKIARGCGVLGV
jgi:hypothetical protein